MEALHDVLKNDLAAGVIPCGRLRANAAWQRLAVMAHNALTALKRLALPDQWLRAHPKRMRFQIFCSLGKLVTHARQVLLRLKDVEGGQSDLPHRAFAIARKSLGPTGLPWMRSKSMRSWHRRPECSRIATRRRTALPLNGCGLCIPLTTARACTPLHARRIQNPTLLVAERLFLNR